MEEKEIKAPQRSISKLTGGDLADALGVLAAEKADIEDREKIHKAEVLKPQFYELIRAYDLEGIVAKRLSDPYGPRVKWLKIKNPDYTQQEGRGELFNRVRGEARSP